MCFHEVLPESRLLKLSYASEILSQSNDETLMSVQSLSDRVNVIIDMGILANGLQVVKAVKIFENKWSLSIRDKKINLLALGIANRYNELTVNRLRSLIKIAKAIDICKGFELNNADEITCALHEKITHKRGGSECKNILRSKLCSYVLTFSSIGKSCEKCNTLLRNIKQERKMMPKFSYNPRKAKKQDKSDELHAKTDKKKLHNLKRAKKQDPLHTKSANKKKRRNLSQATVEQGT